MTGNRPAGERAVLCFGQAFPATRDFTTTDDTPWNSLREFDIACDSDQACYGKYHSKDHAVTVTLDVAQRQH